MATNRNAAIRYQILDACFRNVGKRYFYNTLREEINKVLQDIEPEYKGISQRQLENDITFMESREGYNIELERLKDGRKVFLRYADPSFSIYNQPLNETEVSQLHTAIATLAQFKGLPQFEWMQELLPKLQQGMTTSKQQAIIMDFESNHYLKGIEHLGTLYNAIFYKEALLISYKHFHAEQAEDLEIHPYYLKQYNNRWFLFGYNAANGSPTWNLALDRIESIATSTDSYIDNESVNWEEYFEDIIGVTRAVDAKTEQVKLLFFGKTGNYIETKPLHGSQKNYWKDDNLEVHLQLIINFELEKLILSYGDTVQVLSPASLADAIRGKLQAALLRNS